MKRIVTCWKCQATTSPQKWSALGWLKIEFTYTDGNRWKQYTCKACRDFGPEEVTPHHPHDMPENEQG